MDCLLMRHGIAVDMEDWPELDGTRPLTAQGCKKVRQVAPGLAAMGLPTTHLLPSLLTRARRTAATFKTISRP